MSLLQHEKSGPELPARHQTLNFTTSPVPPPTIPTVRRAKTGSGTFKISDVRGGHWQAFRNLESAFPMWRGLVTLEFVLGRTAIADTNTSPEAKEYAETLMATLGLSKDLILDSGTLGILDKLVAAKADWFIAGGEGCGRSR